MVVMRIGGFNAQEVIRLYDRLDDFIAILCTAAPEFKMLLFDTTAQPEEFVIPLDGERCDHCHAQLVAIAGGLIIVTSSVRHGMAFFHTHHGRCRLSSWVEQDTVAKHRGCR